MRSIEINKCGGLTDKS